MKCFHLTVIALLATSNLVYASLPCWDDVKEYNLFKCCRIFWDCVTTIESEGQTEYLNPQTHEPLAQANLTPNKLREIELAVQRRQLEDNIKGIATG